MLPLSFLRGTEWQETPPRVGSEGALGLSLPTRTVLPGRVSLSLALWLPVREVCCNRFPLWAMPLFVGPQRDTE